MHVSVRPMFAIALIAILGSCHDATAPQRLAEARSLWQAQNLSSYSYTASRECFCVADILGPVRIDVVAGNVSRVTDLTTGAEKSAAGWYTIDQLFDQLLAASDPRTVEFDDTLGYPRKIERCCLSNDSGSIFTASNLIRTG